MTAHRAEARTLRTLVRRLDAWTLHAFTPPHVRRRPRA